jgi:hypothetical protein
LELNAFDAIIFALYLEGQTPEAASSLSSEASPAFDLLDVIGMELRMNVATFWL